MTQRTTEQTLEWLRNHTTTSSIGFNPDGMCLKLARYARNIASAFPTAISAQHATPREYRRYDVAKIRKGMVIYYDDVHDSNPAGHIATVIGRRKEGNPDSLSNLLIRTNSVQSGRTTVVAGDYFQRHWGDEYQFAAVWLNGVVLDMPDRPKPPPPTLPAGGKERLHKVIDILDLMIDNQREANNTKIVNALKRDRDAIRQTLKEHG